MQHQPDLLDLGMARIELFRTLCLPTFQNQTSKNFLWLIWTDPHLHPTLRKPLLRLLDGNPRFIVVASLKCFSSTNCESTGGKGFREGIPFNRSQVWSGDYDLVERYHQRAQSRIVLMSRVDADDGLHIKFAEIMQREALRYMRKSSKAWLIWCTDVNMDWQYYTPWDGPNESGCLVQQKSPYCVSAGLTKAHGVEVAYAEVPSRFKHHEMDSNVPSCREKDITQRCIFPMPLDIAPYALRGRTPTSAGMTRVILKGETDGTINTTELQSSQGKLESVLQTGFAVNPKELITLHRRLQNNLHAITEDALRGQCTGGHSCKTSSRKKLNSILNATAQTPE
mmetsp:Transcript_7263/g.13948  ORF Transcript_7263/g.13948 Transcript_7263/m.13948 type:complete len:339 (+) Transcript_7263:301-1317(+)